MENSLIVGPGLRCLCFVTRSVCGGCCCSHLGSQRTSDLEGVCDILIIGGMLLSVGREEGAILVGLYVSHFSCQYVEIPGATTFHVALPSRLQQSACSLSPARGGILHAYLHAAFTVSPQNCRRDALRGGFSLLCNS